MDLTAIFSNDQLAVIGCFGALAVCGIVAAITFHVGPAGKKSIENSRSSRLQLRQAQESETETEQRQAA